jgi:hypothetical protein
MANLITNASGNFTGAATFASVAAGASAAQIVRSASSNYTGTSYTYSPAFTVTAAQTLDGILVFCVRLGTAGTVEFALSDDNGTTATREVSVNASDLPAYPSWVLIKFGSTLASDGGADYKIGVKASSGGSGVTMYRDGTADNFTRLIRTTAAATAAGSDNLWIVGELTGAGTGNALTVTMNQTSATDYGSIDIGHKGFLNYGTTAATNYVLRCSGNVNVWSNAFLNIGTVGTEIPRDSSAVLEFDPSTDGEFGLYINDGGSFVSQGLSRTSGKSQAYCYLNANVSVNSTSLTVDRDTGWLDNDLIAVASTTRTYTEVERGALNGAAGASTLTVDSFAGAGGGVAFYHDGYSPRQAEIVNLTRNVKIRSTFASNMFAFVTGVVSNCDIDWTEFRYANAVTISSTSRFSIDFSSLYDFKISGFTVSAGTNNIRMSNCVSYNTGFTTGSVFSISEVSNSNVLIDTSIFLGPSIGAVANGFILMPSNITIKNTTFTSLCARALYFYPTVSFANATGLFKDITIHSCGNSAILNQLTGIVTIDRINSWRNAGYCLEPGSTAGVLTCNNWESAGDTNFFIRSDGTNFTQKMIFNNCFISGDNAAYALAYAIFGTYVHPHFIEFNDSTIGFVSGTLKSNVDVAVTTYNNGGVPNHATILFNNTKIGATSLVTAQGSLTDFSYISAQRLDFTNGNHRTWKRFGNVTLDTAIFNTATPSERLLPGPDVLLIQGKLESGKKQTVCAQGGTVTVGVYVRKSTAGDGAAYTGNQPRLILKRNTAMGIAADTLLDTMTVGTGSWEQLTGTTPAALDNGVFEFVVDCDGDNTGWINVDDWSAV